MARSMKVVFREDVGGVAQAGELKNVSAGYARNFLLPRRLAFQATAPALRQWETERQGALAHAERQRSVAQTVIQKIAGVSLTFTAKAGDEGKLFGSIGRNEIAAALAKEGVEIDKKAIVLAEPLKQLGPATITVRVGSGQLAQLKVTVVAEE